MFELGFLEITNFFSEFLLLLKPLPILFLPHGLDHLPPGLNLLLLRSEFFHNLLELPLILTSKLPPEGNVRAADVSVFAPVIGPLPLDGVRQLQAPFRFPHDPTDILLLLLRNACELEVLLQDVLSRRLREVVKDALLALLPPVCDGLWLRHAVLAVSWAPGGLSCAPVAGRTDTESWARVERLDS